MEDILNASLAGGVMIGSSSDLVVHGVVSMAIGFCAGILSTYGYYKITPWLYKKLGVHDTCGVTNLHGIPGFLGGLIGGISATLSPDNVYGDDISVIFAARGGDDPRSGSA
jgi:ammonium transporter Rh